MVLATALLLDAVFDGSVHHAEGAGKAHAQAAPGAGTVQQLPHEALLDERLLRGVRVVLHGVALALEAVPLGLQGREVGRAAALLLGRRGSGFFLLFLADHLVENGGGVGGGKGKGRLAFRQSFDPDRGHRRGGVRHLGSRRSSTRAGLEFLLGGRLFHGAATQRRSQRRLVVLVAQGLGDE